jgi:hypothetical protein
MNNTQKIKLFDIIFEGFFNIASNQVAEAKKITFVNFLLLSKTQQTTQLKNFLTDQKGILQITKDGIPANSTAQSTRIDNEITLIDSVDAAL